jgi:oxygen-independent coproporphyrinogen III oxidase
MYAMNAHLSLNSDLLHRYDKAGPRYTSYPTAPHFTGAFGAQEFQRFARETGEAVASRPLSLYVHIPFCSSPCLYCGCNRVITRSTERGAVYVDRLLREIAIVAPLFGHRDVPQLHFGGGTPNFLTPAQLGRSSSACAGTSALRTATKARSRSRSTRASWVRRISRPWQVSASIG